MQFGITIPLQKHLKIKTLPYGEQADLFYCWELHTIRLQGKNMLAAVMHLIGLRLCCGG